MIDIVEKQQFLRLAAIALLASFVFASAGEAQISLTLEQAESRTGRDVAPVYDGKDIAVSGQLSSRPIMVADSFYVAIQDDTAYGLLLEGPEERFRGWEPGDWVDARGTVVTQGGHPVLVVKEIRRTTHATPPGPKEVTTAELASFRYLGVLVTTQAVISAENQNAGPATYLFWRARRAWRYSCLQRAAILLSSSSGTGRGIESAPQE